jgi:hypothetical protein
MSSIETIHEALIEQATAIEKRKDGWTTDGYQEKTQDTSYERTFATALKAEGVKSFKELFRTRKEANLPNNVLDLMGSAIYPKAADYIDNAIGVRIKDNDPYLQEIAKINRPDSAPDIDKTFTQEKRHIIEGNVFTRQTVTDIKEQMQQMGISGFDVITCRPDFPFRAKSLNEAGIEAEPDLPKYYAIQLKRYTAMLSPGGLMFVQVPQNETVYVGLDTLTTSLKTEGLDVKVMDADYPESSKVMLIKKTGYPHKC